MGYRERLKPEEYQYGLINWRGFRYRDISFFIDYIKLKEYDKLTEDYINNPEKYVRNHILFINGKYRNIVTYKHDENGALLRAFHKSISEYFITKYSPSSHSFAYHKKRNILMCLNKHKDSSFFFKTDIHAFFDSISYDNTVKILKGKRKLIQSKEENIDKEELMKSFNKLLTVCFYNNTLPIGFVSSPVISDIYLSSFDRYISKSTDCVYTRYADDIIISTSSEKYRKEFEIIKKEIVSYLNKLDLQLNYKKTYIRTLAQPGDAIHLLGLNVVKSEVGQNRITVSKRYLVETCKMFCDMIDNSSCFDSEEIEDKAIEIYGRISFIKQSSNDSFRKFIRMVMVKSEIDLENSGGINVNYLKEIIKGN